MDKEKSQQQPQQSADPAAKNGNEKSDEFQDEFYNTGRIGRRNAMPDILGNNCTASAGGDLPLKLSALTTNGKFPRDSLCVIKCSMKPPFRVIIQSDNER